MQLLRATHLSLTRSQRRPRRGATMVEFAFFFIIFLMLTLGLMELGRAVWTYVTLSHAARAAGRYAIVHGGINPITVSDPSITQVARDNAIGLDSGNVTVSIAYDNGTGTPALNTQGNVVQVRVSYPFRFVAVGLIVPQSIINMQSTARMTVLN